MPAPSLFSLMVIALMAGVIARRVVGGRHSHFACLIVGTLGTTTGVVAAGLFQAHITGLISLALAALAGAVVLLSAAALICRR